ncbi:hypothetical protein B0H13DRAFT_1869758 [Mycena leptocephala]|nr:hypothetical protein B0H13DRAFT_1869758 [Mycena leptocephala]
MPSWISLRVGASTGSEGAGGRSVEACLSGDSRRVAIGGEETVSSGSESELNSNGALLLNGGFTSKAEGVVNVSSRGEEACAVSRVVTGTRGFVEEGTRGLRVGGSSAGGDNVREEFLNPSLVRAATAEV